MQIQFCPQSKMPPDTSNAVRIDSNAHGWKYKISHVRQKGKSTLVAPERETP